MNKFLKTQERKLTFPEIINYIIFNIFTFKEVLLQKIQKEFQYI